MAANAPTDRRSTSAHPQRPQCLAEPTGREQTHAGCACSLAGAPAEDARVSGGLPLAHHHPRPPTTARHRSTANRQKTAAGGAASLNEGAHASLESITAYCSGMRTSMKRGSAPATSLAGSCGGGRSEIRLGENSRAANFESRARGRRQGAGGEVVSGRRHCL